MKPESNNQPKTLSQLFEHGIEVFGTKENFTTWLERENFLFENKPPAEFLKTDSGINFIDDRLTGLEYGDNA